MMMKWTAAIGLSAIIILSGCSLLDEANNTLTYATDMTDFLNETQQFATDVPALLESAASNPNIVGDVQTQFESMQQDIDFMQEIEVPAAAEGIHGKVLDYSVQLETGISDALVKLENGVVDPAAIFKNTELLQTIQELQDLRMNIEQLGQ
ncbi:DUF6376 family protein [Domibacillus aminovorans]|uniref:Lipoprotein n=1 Tax=Domibacillus aminovorans TaxID=29332 RepID=A0A177L3K4_9BACI|nr:DUF6376 family protein [Domibacillus aminovorans]OAH60258.1 hypothetical protein AWH49_17475 [Domibacillus aminovorans]